MPSKAVLLAALLLFAGVANARELTFEADVRPILKQHCFHCHGEHGAAEGGLDLRLRRFLVRGGESGPAIELGEPDGSLLVQRVEASEMPPGEDKQVPAPQLEILRRWVKAKAPTAREEPESLDNALYFTAEERNWWAFQPIVRPPTPVVGDALDSPLDAFVIHRLRTTFAGGDQSFSLAAPAQRSTLIRRVFIDLLGVPPTPDETTRFVEDPSPDAWPRLVDRVLASPRYGERWGRHWLDVAGYADSEGYTDKDAVRANAWRYRDYVIRALNHDKPYSQFVLEQLAGDELVGWPQAELRAEITETLAATGFLRTAPDGTADQVDQAVARNQVVADTLEIVGTAILGLSVQCARCHDHRYDPIPQVDYYQLRAIFEPAMDWKSWRTPPQRLVSLYSEADRQRKKEIEGRAAKVHEQRQERVDFYIDKTLEHELLMVSSDLQEPLRVAFKTPKSDRSAAHKKLLADHPNIANITASSLYLYDRRRDARAKALDQRRLEEQAKHLLRIRTSALAAVDEALAGELKAALATPLEMRDPRQQELLAKHPAASVDAATLSQFDPAASAELKRFQVAAEEIRGYRIRTELQKLLDNAKAISDTIPKEHFLRITSEPTTKAPPTFVFHRGDHKQPREQVAATGLSVLGGVSFSSPPTQSSKQKSLPTTGRRLRFARYLTNGRHPLVARVIANRVWAGHFGKGIVGTSGDFGFLGDRPTHPQLLDWLAAELMENDWSLKHLHRAILLSRVYQQSAVAEPRMIEVDPENRGLGRWPLQRLRSETLRDAVLKVAGTLNSRMFGEPVPVMEDEVGQIVLGKENLDGERKPTKPIPLGGAEYRRSIYIQVRRSRPLGLLESFDLPDLSPNCSDRPSSNVAPQSLMLMNSDFVVAASSSLAERLERECGGDRTEQLRRGWRLMYGVAPNSQQLTQAKAFLATQTAAFAERDPDAKQARRAALSSYCQALFGSTRFLYVE